MATGDRTERPRIGSGERPRKRSFDAGDVTLAYVGGGSREWAPKLVQDLALSDLEGEVRLYDVDRESAERNARFGNWVDDREAATADWRYEAVADLESALAGADAVLLSTQYDPAETFVHDLEVPKEYGIYGAVSATIGPGGILRAMRTLPRYREFAAAIREHCPGAWVCNFTNPVTFVTRALYDEYPEINAVGLCHEVLGTRSHLAGLASEHLGVDADRGDVQVNVKGINHFTWVDEARCDGIDLWPLLEELAEQPEANRTYSPADLEGMSPFADNWQVTWELFRRFGMLPAAGDRHLVEYAPWFMNGGEEQLTRWGVKRTGSDYRAKHWHPEESEQTTDVTAWMEGEREFTLERSGETLPDILAALAGGGTGAEAKAGAGTGAAPYVTNVNLPNTGQVEGLERGAVVETNAVVRTGELRPVAAGGFPRPIRSVVADHVDTQEAVVEASRTGDVDAAFRAFLADPQVRKLDTEDARDLFADLVAAQREYLTDWDLAGAEVLAEAEAGRG